MFPFMLAFWQAYFSFNVALADIGPYYRSAAYANGSFGKWPYQTYHSSPLLGPVLNIQQLSDQCDDGSYTLITPRGHAVPQPGPMILDHRGNLVWSQPAYGRTYGLAAQKYKGRDYLTFWSGNDSTVGRGNGSFYMLDSFYDEAYVVRSPDENLYTDLHGFKITRNDTAIFTVYEIVPADLKSVNGSETGWIWDSGFQEINIETKRVLFDWRATAHYTFQESYRLPHAGEGQDKATPWDFFHINSVDKDTNGNYLISSRYTSSLGYVEGATGRVLWKLGGKENMFRDVSSGLATSFSGQHHAQFQGDTTVISLFDNGRDFRAQHKKKRKAGRGISLQLSPDTMTVKVRGEYRTHRDIYSRSQGSMQVLENGHIILGHGFSASWTEFTPEGKILCNVDFGPESGFDEGNVISYQVQRHDWHGIPRTTPAVVQDGSTIYVSWNGATEVVEWVLEGTGCGHKGESSGFEFLTSTRKQGFETGLAIPGNSSCELIRVRGLSPTAETLVVTTALENTIAGMRIHDDGGLPRFKPRRELLIVILFGELTVGVSLLSFAVKMLYNRLQQ